jgi:hypothetical protein
VRFFDKSLGNVELDWQEATSFFVCRKNFLGLPGLEQACIELV